MNDLELQVKGVSLTPRQDAKVKYILLIETAERKITRKYNLLLPKDFMPLQVKSD